MSASRIPPERQVIVSVDDLQAVLRHVNYMGNRDLVGPVDRMGDAACIVRQRLVLDAEAEASHVINPEAIGNPDMTPVVQATAGLRALLRPCPAAAPSRDGYCGGVNGHHAADCPAPDGSQR